MYARYGGTLTLTTDLKYGPIIIVPQMTPEGKKDEIYQIEKIGRQYRIGRFVADSPMNLLRKIGEALELENEQGVEPIQE